MLASKAADSAPRPRGWLPWWLGALALHAVLLWPRPVALRPEASPAVGAAPALRLRALAPPVSPAAPTPPLPPAPPAATALRVAGATRPPPHPASAEPPAAAPLPPPASERDASTAPAASPALALPGAARWGYVLTHEGHAGEAWLEWRREPGTDGAADAERYTLVLHRRTEQRALPRWESRGELGLQGLAPQRFAVQRGRQGQRVIHDAEAQPTAQQQDRLSWMLQLPALLQARPEAQVAELAVVDWRGRTHPWRFERVGAEPVTLPDGQVRQAQRWRRVAQGQAQAEIELWLDPADAQRPLRLVHKVLGDERWELLWNPAASGASP